MRTKHTFRLPPDLAAQLADYAHRKRVPQALVVETALSVRGRRLSLPQEICPVSLRRLRMPRGILTAGQKSAEGVLGDVVGKASEALHAERRSQQIGQAGNGH